MTFDKFCESRLFAVQKKSISCFQQTPNIWFAACRFLPDLAFFLPPLFISKANFHTTINFLIFCFYLATPYRVFGFGLKYKHLRVSRDGLIHAS